MSQEKLNPEQEKWIKETLGSSLSFGEYEMLKEFMANELQAERRRIAEWLETELSPNLDQTLYHQGAQHLKARLLSHLQSPNNQKEA